MFRCRSNCINVSTPFYPLSHVTYPLRCRDPFTSESTLSRAIGLVVVVSFSSVLLFACFPPEGDDGTNDGGDNGSALIGRRLGDLGAAAAAAAGAAGSLVSLVLDEGISDDALGPSALQVIARSMDIQSPILSTRSNRDIAFKIESANPAL